jgi:hypothetical protein
MGRRVTNSNRRVRKGKGLIMRHILRRASKCALSIGTLLVALLSLPAASPAAGICGPWNLVPTPNVGNSVTRLTAVTVLSPSDAWSVGYWRSEPVGRGPVAMRWNGSVWALTDLPETGHLGTFPETEGVDAASNGDVWLAGNVTTTYPTNNLPLVLRWRDGSWDYVDTVTLRPQTEYPFAARGGFAYEVDALTGDDVWAVGIANGYGDASSSSVAMALHWDGSSWTDVEVPIVANRHNQLNDVVAISHDDVWAVGDYRNIAGTFRAVTFHWNGQDWSHVYSPIEEISQSSLDDVAATGPNDVWALGGGDSGVVLMHWNGSQWSIAQPPPNSGGSLIAVGPNDLWVSGWNGFWHWNGVSWTEVPTSVPGATYVIRSGGMERVGDCDIWCVGFWTLADGITSSTLAERLQLPPATVDATADAGVAARFPNPYRPGDEIRLALPSTTSASVTVYNLQGVVVRSLALESVGAGGSQSLSWDGRTDTGRQLPSGVYFVKLEAGATTVYRKLLLLGSER